MGAKVFISCGQASDKEREVATLLASWFRDQGYTPYIAIEAQSILDLNAGIIGELKTSDYYLFVNFRRESIGDGKYRGSLFTNQELAIAYALEFEHMLMVSQTDVRREGVFQFMVSNIPEFTDFSEVVDRVQTAVDAAKWQPTYTRNLRIHSIYFTPYPFRFGGIANGGTIRALHASIRNDRKDLGALETIARLASITDQSGEKRKSPDGSQLKATGHRGYSRTIWPEDEGIFDLLAIDMDNPSRVYLMSELDVSPREPIIVKLGVCYLDYEVFSQGFPRLSFCIKLSLTGSKLTNDRVIAASLQSPQLIEARLTLD